MNPLIQGLLWLDAEPARAEVLAALALGLTAAWALAGSRTDTRTGRLVFAAGVLATLAAFRWRSWVVPHDLNPDEAQMLAGAITLRHFPVYWLHVDGTTHGPVCEYLLVAAAWLGAPLNYITARAVAALLQGMALLATWRTLRRVTSEQTARLAVLPGLAFWSLVAFHDFVNYSTELPGLALTAIAGWLLARVLAGRAESTRRGQVQLALAGVALGLVPLAKLQGAPPAALLGLAILVILWRRHGRAGNFSRPAAWLLAGAALPVVGLGVFLFTHQLTADFWTAYIAASVDYSGSGHHSLAGMLAAFFPLANVAHAFALFLGGTIAFCALGARPAVRAAPALRPAQVAAAGFWLASWLAVIFARREVTHYLHLLVIPTCLLAGTILAGAEIASGVRRWQAIAGFALLALVPQILHRDTSWPIYTGRVAANLAERPTIAADYLRRQAQPGDTLAVWGWEPNLYVETGLPQGTREAHTACQMSIAPLQGYYVRRYLADLVRRSPTWFVDAIQPNAFAFRDRGQYGHESMAELHRLIADRYEFVAEFSGRRIYRLRPVSP
jgi:hypothetical protein